MFKKLLITLLFLSPLQSCNFSESYFLTYQSKLKVVERQDHQKCVSQGLDYEEWGDIITEMYWRCRYDLIMARKVNDATSAELIKNNAAIDKISNEILNNLNRAKSAALAKIEDDIEFIDHKKCDQKGYSFAIDDLNDNYDRCRQSLILSKTPNSSKSTNSSKVSALSPDRYAEYMSIAYVRRNNKEANLIAETMQKYPNCVGLNIKSDDFKKCSAATDESKICLANIDSLQEKKALEDKIYCQQQAFVQFPDNYALAKEKSAGEIEKLKLTKKVQNDEESNKENNATLAYLESDKNIENIGRYVEDVDNKEEQSKDRLYSRIELLKLRERFIFQCNKKMEDKLPDFNKRSSQDCVDIATNWDK